ncbi:hypothetical protein MAP00_000578 [Monascus purpureus]|nr:hypothetical protein MAP00_000578 [Monascus purpureus]
MGENPRSALEYGHLGHATYYPELRSWTFPRTLAKSPLVSYSGITKTTVPSPISAPRTSLQGNNGTLARIYPQIAPSWPCIRDERLSRVISATTNVCEPRVASLFDLGNAADVDNDVSGRVFPIAVFATGECGDTICFRKIEDDAVELRQESVWMRVPSVGGEETTEWSGCGAPVRQIRFARTVDAKSTWMAARFPLFTAIFRPLYHRNPVAMHFDHDGFYGSSFKLHNSRLDANALIEISASQTGGFVHADVTFNPWYQKQVAIVDETGNWSIWEISSRQKQNKSSWNADCVRSGSLPRVDPSDNADLHNQARHDGWAAIEWVADFNSFIVSDRRCVSIYRMDGDQTICYPIELGFERKSEWVLDVKRSSYDMSHVFILTTSRIFWFDITTSTILASTEEGRLSPKPRLSWRHFRDFEDTTLRLSFLLVGENLYLILYSRLNRLVQVFQYPTSQTEPLSIPDPFLLNIPSRSENLADSHTPGYDVQFTTLVFKEVAYSLSSKKGHGPTIRPIKLFALDSQLALHESIYFGPGDDYHGEENLPGGEILRARKRFPGGHGNKRWYSDFVVDDWDESISIADLLTRRNTWAFTPTPPTGSSWTFDFTQIYQVTMGELTVTSKQANQKQQPEKCFRELLRELENRISKRALSTLSTNQTILEILSGSPSLDDIDQNARDLNLLVSVNMRKNTDSQNPPLFVILKSSVPSTMSVELGSRLQLSSNLDLVAMYDRLANDWLSNLSHDIPGRTRLLKERIIRGIAAEIVLSRVKIIPTVARVPDRAGAEDLRNDREITAMTSPPRSVHVTELELPLTPSVDVRPASLSIERELGVAAGKEEIPGRRARQGDQVNPDFATLSTLTTVNGRRPLSRIATSILSHWHVGMDPCNYDWHKSSQAQDNEEARATTPKHRSRRKVSNGLSLESSTHPSTSSAAPVVREWGSQPQTEPPRVQLKSSQVTEDSLPMTQVERGIFGGREGNRRGNEKGRKKRRAAGF